MNGQILLQIDALAAALRSDADLIPLQRRIRRCRVEIYAILDAGVTVRALAGALAQRGVTDQHGEPLSYGHCRVLLARIEPAQSKPTATPTTNSATPQKQGSAQPIAVASNKNIGKRPDFSQGFIRDDERNTQIKK